MIDGEIDWRSGWKWFYWCQVYGSKPYELSYHIANVVRHSGFSTVGVGDRGMAVDGNADLAVDFFEAEVLSVREDHEEYAGSFPGACPERGRSRRRMVMPERSFSTQAYRYGFNGKATIAIVVDNEWKGEGNSYAPIAIGDGFRVHDARLGRFLSVDPLAPDYPWYTPYQFAGNKPTRKIDLDGLEEADPKEFKAAIQFVQSFYLEQSKVFPTISANILKEQLLQRLYNPRLIYQGNSWFCGPAFVSFSVAVHDPMAYAKTVLKVYSSGTINSQSDILPLSYRLKRISCDEDWGEQIDEMPIVDYLLISTMRHIENDGITSIISAGPNPNDPLIAGTWPSEIDDLIGLFDPNFTKEEIDKTDVWGLHRLMESGLKIGFRFNKNHGKSTKTKAETWAGYFGRKKGVHYAMIDKLEFSHEDGELKVTVSWWDYGDRNKGIDKLTKATWSLKEWDDHVHALYKFEQK